MEKLKGKKHFPEKLLTIRSKKVLDLSFGERIILLRSELGMSQADLAHNLKIGLSTINNYENDLRKPDCDMLLSISNIFKVSTDFLLGKTAIRTPDIENREISERTGLTEKTIKYLHLHIEDVLPELINFLVENEETESDIMDDFGMIKTFATGLLLDGYPEAQYKKITALKITDKNYDKFASHLESYDNWYMQLELSVFKLQVKFFDLIKVASKFSAIEKEVKSHKRQADETLRYF